MLDKIIVFMFGSIVGSFLNVCIHRLPRGESIVRPPSHCPDCNAVIRWYDNIPIASFLVLKGRCRSCKAKIRPRYFIVELLTASLFFGLYIFFGPSVRCVSSLVFVSLLIVATFVDFEHEEIPDEVSLGGIVLGTVLSLVFPQLMGTGSHGVALIKSIVGAVVGGASIYGMGFVGKIVFKKEAMGGGDVKLMAMIGAFLGWKHVLLAFFMAPFFGSIVGIALKLKKGAERIPYGPYLSLAALIAFLFGNELLRLLLFGYR